MPAKKEPRKSAAEPRRIKAFEGVRSKPVRKAARSVPPRDPANHEPRGAGARSSGDGSVPGSAEEARRKVVDDSGAPAEGVALLDPRADPEVMFRILSDKIAAKVDRAAMKAGASAAQEVGRRLTAELDAAIAGAQSTAGKMGSLVQQAVQSAVDEALRTAVLNATRVREEHLAQLALIDRTAQTAQDITAVRLRVEEEMRRSGITRVTEADPESFNLVNPGEHADSRAYEVLAPAYTDSRTGRVVQRGEMRRVPSHADPVTEGGEDR
ncbi:hypothetical protein [Streptomyces hilarionis]|uniref:hypothetical protein n=1 Tax=Streptomyces hilarionis TaxID=2839954 RepID=UPI002119BEE5|nr:hypothetical protein [Streptomyces hilarionis]MCQ9131580.1 hypothetical protein [Streptomyces hilarionis]